MLKLDLVGYASGIAANNLDCALGPLYLQQHPEYFKAAGLDPVWHAMVNGVPFQPIGDILQVLYERVTEYLPLLSPLVIVGGDHSMAIATWHAVMSYYGEEKSLGLIWVDAHLDAHTPETSHSKNMHGMPLAHLLGLWKNPILKMPHPLRSLNPQNVCMIGVRSYEPEEYEHLKRLGVKIYFMDEVWARGIDVIMREAREYLKSRTDIQGLSVDLDAFDPQEISGVGCPEADGISPQAFLEGIHLPDWSVVEIAEYNPMLDIAMKSANFIPQLLKKVIK